MEKLLNKCPICGEKLIYSALMQYSLNFQLKRNGELSSKGKKRDEGSMECGYIYCTNSNCNFITDCDLDCENHPNIKIYQSGNKYYYKNKDEDDKI